MDEQLPNESSDNNLQLSVADRKHLAQLNKNFQLVADITAGVAQGYHTGAIITGRGGVGKSWTVTRELERLCVPYVLANTHLTPKGLFDLIMNLVDLLDSGD